MGNKSGKAKKKDVKILTELDCPKGELDKKKFITVYNEFFPKQRAEKFSAEVFKLFDTDHSGKIDFSEYLIAIATSDNGDVKKKLHLAFNLYDSNHNGRIDKKEMLVMLNAIYDLKGIENRKGDNDPKERANAIFRKMDTDFTNTLSEDEFVNGCLGDPILKKTLNIFD